jgi:ABC-type phosphonate transport system ATPase subunit
LEQVLAIVGDAGSNKEMLLDSLLHYSQAQEGRMLGTIKHVSDGDVPQ